MGRGAKFGVVLAVCAVLLGACSTAPGGGTGPVEPAVPSGDDTIGLNQLQYLGSHNSYKQAPTLGLLAALGLGAALAPALAGSGLDPAQLNYGHAAADPAAAVRHPHLRARHLRRPHRQTGSARPLAEPAAGPGLPARRSTSPA